jgi:hypothetical protein
MLVGVQLPLPGAVAACISGNRATAEKAAVAQDENAAVPAHHAVEHMHVK